MDIINDEQKALLQKLVQESVNSSYRIDGEKQLKKDIAQRAEDELGIKKKRFTALVTLAYKDNSEEFNQETTEILDLAEAVGIYQHNKDEESE